MSIWGQKKAQSDPKYLTEAARGRLRSCFCEADAGLTGARFAIAETGGIVICTNEGNADLGIGMPKIHIACMGVEKLLPRAGRSVGLPAPCSHGPPPASPSPHIRHTFMVRSRAKNCIL
ncbi:MAG UNVERIFIED_CONTAM: LUD domain-containing protein [Planctomycetaceae bacterium]|jgi:L-lactate utilization protein LutB